MKDDIIRYTLFTIPTALWTGAVLHDVINWSTSMGWLIVDIFIPPFGLARGAYLLTGYLLH